MNNEVYIQAKVLEAFDFFNKELFEDQLPQVIINFSRQNPKSMGYFSGLRWEKGKDDKAHEISLNPVFFKRGLKDTYSTLVHDMVHLWHFEYGENPPKNGYHNKYWAEKMKQAGLYPSDTGVAGGKETGSNMSHYIVEGGAYDQCFDRLPDTAKINYISLEQYKESKVKKDRSKTKYTCASCEVNAWAKPDTKLFCGACTSKTKLVLMVAA